MRTKLRVINNIRFCKVGMPPIIHSLVIHLPVFVFPHCPVHIETERKIITVIIHKNLTGCILVYSRFPVIKIIRKNIAKEQHNALPNGLICLKGGEVAREAEPGSPERKEYNARQNSFKILINSFYGYLGLGTAIFGDTALAAEVTKTGRELLVKLMEAFKAEGCEILEADTDGIYLSSEEYFSKPEDLLQKVLHALPEGIDLDYDGSYSAMLCYKAKNYALLDGDHVILKGSAFRNRATEPFLRKLTQTLIYDKLLGRDDEVPAAIESMRGEISSGKADIYDLAKGEYISKSPAQYQSDVMSTGKGRRAAMEAALLMRPLPEVGDKVSYYITRGDGKKAPDWKRARPL